jgi:hypothetical protein
MLTKKLKDYKNEKLKDRKIERLRNPGSLVFPRGEDDES